MFTSVVYTHFDPPGLTSPVSITMRHEMGLICLFGGGWDETIPHSDPNSKSPTTHERCKQIIGMFYDLSRVSFPRCLRPLSAPVDAQPVLVVFLSTIIQYLLTLEIRSLDISELWIRAIR